MSTENRYTLAEYAQLAGVKGVQMDVVQTIEDTEPLFASAPLVRCNNGRVHMTQVITKYPVGQTRGFNQGVVAEKAASRVVMDTCAMMAMYNEIDVNIVRMNGDSAKWRANEDKATVMGLTRTAADKIFNASAKKDPNDFDGLRVRFNKINGKNVLTAGGTGSDGDLEDIFLVNWGTNSVHLIYPEGGIAGLRQTFERNVDARDEKNRIFKVDRTWYEWDMGLAVPDPAQVIRICNVPVTKALNGRGTDGYDLIHALIQASEALPNGVNPGAAIYMSRKMRTALRLQINDTPNVNLTWENVAGKEVVRWDNIAVHKVEDKILTPYTTPIA